MKVRRAVTCHQAGPEMLQAVCTSFLDLQKHLVRSPGAIDWFRNLSKSRNCNVCGNMGGTLPMHIDGDRRYRAFCDLQARL